VIVLFVVFTAVEALNVPSESAGDAKVNDALESLLMPLPVLRVIEVDEGMLAIVYGPPVKSVPVTVMPTIRLLVEVKPVIVLLPEEVAPVRTVPRPC
jgi:hypothetical protein